MTAYLDALLGGLKVAGTPANGNVPIWNATNVDAEWGAPAVPFTPSPIVRHDTTFSPAALWQLDGTLNDTSGNGFTLVNNGGTYAHADLYPGVAGLYQFAGSTFRTNVTPSPAGLRIAGDMTVEALLWIPARANMLNKPFFACDASGSGSTFNRQYGVAWTALNGAPSWTQQHGSQVTDTYTLTSLSYPTGLCHFAVTRTSNVIQFYCNGLPLGAASSALTTPDGGSVGIFQFGSLGGVGTELQMGSFKIIASALTAAQVKAEYNRTLGGVFGVRA